jgi:predicted nuclease of restriction endonuclease-like (RecB) superfamily
MANLDKKYTLLFTEIIGVLSSARSQAVKAINAALVNAYWNVGRKIVMEEQRGAKRAGYGEQLLQELARDLTASLGRGFSVGNLRLMRQFYNNFPENHEIHQTVSGESHTVDFPLSWSHYTLLIRLQNSKAQAFYHTEALRGGWSVRQLKRQIDSRFYERLALSRNKTEMLNQVSDEPDAESEIKDPFVLEFLNLKDEYAESDLEEGLVGQLEEFLLELGSGFTFVGRQKRLRIGEEWLRVDLVMFHRHLRCLVLIDLKLGKFTHADAGQMHTYLNYARSHWMLKDENPPVGIILCADKDEALAKYALEGLPNQVLAAEYKLRLPDEQWLAKALAESRERLALKKEAEC